MQYWFSRLPNSGLAKKFKVRSEKKDHETLFTFPYTILGAWGNPKEHKLEQLMIVYLKRHGWPKAAVEFNIEKTPKNLSNFVASLIEEKEKK